MSTQINRICFVGDSLTLGVGDPEGLGWVGRLLLERRRQGIELTGYNLGVRRNTSLDIAVRWKKEVLVRLPDAQPGAIIFAFGTNDCLMENGGRRVSLSTTLAVAREILSDALQIAPVLLLGPPPTASSAENLRVEELSEQMGRLCLAIDVPFFDSFSALADEQVWRRELGSGDGYHPAGGGYSALASRLAQWSAWRDLTLPVSWQARGDQPPGDVAADRGHVIAMVGRGSDEAQSC